MELLLLLLLVPIIWLLLWPARLAGRIRRHRFAGAGLLAAGLVVGWLGLQSLAPPPPAEADYAAGQARLRALLK